jgi:hypothetical protein
MSRVFGVETTFDYASMGIGQLCAQASLIQS